MERSVFGASPLLWGLLICDSSAHASEWQIGKLICEVVLANLGGCLDCIQVRETQNSAEGGEGGEGGFVLIDLCQSF